MEELDGARPVLRVRRDADGDGRLQLRFGCSTREAGVCHGGAQAFGDLQRVCVTRLGEQHGKFLPAEAGGNVFCAKLFLQHTSDTAQDLVPGQVPVGVVDVAKEVEVGEQDRHRRLYSPCFSQFAIDRQLEVLRVEEPCLRIASGLMLEQRNLEPLAKQQ